jgi:hypothetical protein
MAGPELLALATVVSSGASIVQGVQASNAAKANARAYEADAVAAQQAAALAEQQSRRESERLLSTQRARYAAAGVTLEGSPLLVQVDSAKQAELEALTIRYGGNVEATANRNKAAFQRSNASAYRAAGLINAGQTLLAGANDGVFKLAPTGPSYPVTPAVKTGGAL